MATILISTYPEVGHLNPSYKIAKNLKAIGHRVCYLALPDFRASIHSQGFEFISIFEQLYPEGFLSKQAQEKGLYNIDALLQRMKEAIRQEGFNPFKEFTTLLKEIGPDLLIIDILLCHPLLMPALGNLPTVLLNTILFDPWEGPEYPDKPHLNMPELILCPEDFDFPLTLRSYRRHYIEASVDLKRREASLPWDALDKRKPLIYFSLGNQGNLCQYSDRFFQAVVETMKLRGDWQAIFSVGSQLKGGDFQPFIPNLMLVNGACQIQILQKASLMVTHGGLGSIKECILLGVPMIIFPLTREQPMNAARVIYHGLGVRGDIRAVTAQQMIHLIEQVENSATIGRSVRIMQKKFLEVEESGRGARIIEEILSKQLREKID